MQPVNHASQPGRQRESVVSWGSAGETVPCGDTDLLAPGRDLSTVAITDAAATAP